MSSKDEIINNIKNTAILAESTSKAIGRLEDSLKGASYSKGSSSSNGNKNVNIDVSASSKILSDISSKMSQLISITSKNSYSGDQQPSIAKARSRRQPSSANNGEQDKEKPLIRELDISKKLMTLQGYAIGKNLLGTDKFEEIFEVFNDIFDNPNKSVRQQNKEWDIAFAGFKNIQKEEDLNSKQDSYFSQQEQRKSLMEQLEGENKTRSDILRDFGVHKKLADLQGYGLRQGITDTKEFGGLIKDFATVFGDTSLTPQQQDRQWGLVFQNFKNEQALLTKEDTIANKDNKNANLFNKAIGLWNKQLGVMGTGFTGGFLGATLGSTLSLAALSMGTSIAASSALASQFQGSYAEKAFTGLGLGLSSAQLENYRVASEKAFGDPQTIERTMSTIQSKMFNLGEGLRTYHKARIAPSSKPLPSAEEFKKLAPNAQAFAIFDYIAGIKDITAPVFTAKSSEFLQQLTGLSISDILAIHRGGGSGIFTSNLTRSPQSAAMNTAMQDYEKQLKDLTEESANLGKAWTLLFSDINITWRSSLNKLSEFLLGFFGFDEKKGTFGNFIKDSEALTKAQKETVARMGQGYMGNNAPTGSTPYAANMQGNIPTIPAVPTIKENTASKPTYVPVKAETIVKVEVTDKTKGGVEAEEDKKEAPTQSRRKVQPWGAR